ncbi:retrovirus-related pol polyprotein from transposon TNT 1-94 [Tanacetum coccineum]
MDSMILIRQRNTLAEYMISSGADKRPHNGIDKDLYDSLEKLKRNGLIITKKYCLIICDEKIQADCDMKASNIILQGLPADIYSLLNHHKVAKDLWERVQLLMQDTSLTKQEREYKLYDHLISDNYYTSRGKHFHHIELFYYNCGSKASSHKKNAMISQTPRITSTKVVPLKETTSYSVETQKPKIKVYSRRPKQVKSVSSSKKAKILKSKIANNSKPNHTWGSNATDVPSSSSLVNDRVYYVEGLKHNLFNVGQFCDLDLEVTFRKNTCFIQNLDSVDLLSGSRDTNLYIISLDDMLKTSSICLLSKALKIKSWLWHRQLSHLNFACALGKSKKSSHQPKAEDTNQEKLYLLHIDLYGPMRVESINRKKYILVIVDDYSRFTWVKFLRLKDEAPDAIIKCIKNIQVRLNATVCNVRTDNGTEFVNQSLREFYENVSISYQTSVARTPQ